MTREELIREWGEPRVVEMEKQIAYLPAEHFIDKKYARGIYRNMLIKVTKTPECAMPFRPVPEPPKPLTSAEKREERRIQEQEALAASIRQRAAGLRAASDRLYDLANEIEWS